MSKRRGRPAKYVMDGGQPIVGLSYDKKLHQYYTTHHKPKIYFGSELDKARYDFRQWKAKQAKEPISEYEISDNAHDEVLMAQQRQVSNIQFLTNRFVPLEEEIPIPKFKAHIPESLKFQIVKEVMGKYTLDRIADETGIDDFRNMKEWIPPKPSMTLTEVREFYTTKKDSEKKEINFVLNKWDYFVSVIKCETLDEIKSEHIKLYYDTVMKLAYKKELKPKGIKNYWRPSSVINYARDRGIKHKEGLDRVHSKVPTNCTL